MLKHSSGFLLILVAAVSVWAQSADMAVEAIAKRYATVSEKVRLCETDEDQGQFGELFMNELTINSRSHQWRAVGIYGQTFKFFYRAVENDEKRLYPDQLVFVKTQRKISARSYAEEYLFSDKGDLIFYFQRAEGDDETPAERRVYFAGPKAVRVIEDSKKRDRLTAADGKTAAEIIASSRRLVAVFNGSLKL